MDNIFFTFGLLISVIVLAINNNKLSNEVIKLRGLLKEKGLLETDNKPIEKVPIKEEKSDINQISKSIEAKKEEIKPIVKEKPKYTDKEIKNSSILIVGSILVVLAALIFLATTWDVTNDIFKAIMLFVMLFVFYFASRIAKKINLNQTHKAFHYITLAYIPISLLSLWVFKLIGEYYSIDGEGSLLYLSLCSFIVCGIYYIDSVRNNSKSIGIISFLLLVLGVLFIDLKMEARIETFIFSILIIGIILTLMDRFKKHFISEFVNKTGIEIVTFASLYIHVLSSLGVLLLDTPIFLSVINTLILLYLVYNKCKNNNMKVFNAVYPLFIFLAFLNMTGLFDNTSIKQSIMIFSFILVCFTDLFTTKQIRKTTYYETLGASVLLYLFTMANNSIPSYIVVLTFLAISIIFYFQDEEKANYKLYFVSILSYLLLIDITNYYDLSVLLLGFVCLSIISIILILNDKKYNSFKYVGYILMFLLTPSFEFNSLGSLILLGLFTLITLVYSVNHNDRFTRIVSYIYLNILTYSLFTYVGITENELIIPICNVFILLSEIILNENNKAFNKVLVYICYGISSLILISLNSEIIHLLLAIINTVLLCYYCKMNNENEKYKYIPYIVAIPFMFFGEILTINDINYMNMISLLLILLFAYMIYITKDDKYTLLYFIFLALNTVEFDNNKYFILLLFGIGSIINYLYREGKNKDIFKVSIYLYLLILSQFIVNDLNLKDISVFTYGMYIIFAIVIIRDTLKKYIKSYKLFEYISLVLINLFAMSNFVSESDGLLFVFFLLFVVVISYLFKYGPAFLISLIFIIINSIILTKEFWLNLPWWLYVLLIGASLIAFAVRNEIKDKNEDGQIIKKLKDNLDL